MTFWLLASLLVGTLLLANNLRWYYELEVMQAAALGLPLVVAWRLWAVRRWRKQRESNAQRRLGELQRDLRTDGQVRIEGMAPTLPIMGGILVTALFVMMYLGTERISSLVFAALTAICVVIAALWRIAKWGQPLLIVSREGVAPAGYGLLPWSAVYGIECHTPHGKHTSGTVLNLYVPGLQAHLGSAHPVIRFFRSIPGTRARNYVDVITIPLRKASELPFIIERLCRTIWQDATGRTHSWSIHLSRSQVQFARMLDDAEQKMKQAPPTMADLEQMRGEMQNLKRHAQQVHDEFRSLQAWSRVWTVPGAFALVLLVGQVPLSRWLGFVPTDAWSKQAFVIAAVLVIIAWSLIIGHARNVFGASFTKLRLVQVLVTLTLTSILVLPMTWFLITDVGGVLAADGGKGPNEQMTVIATKKEKFSRRGCSYFLTHPAFGKRMCLVRAQFLTYPNQVPVVLSIRRNPLGYKVYEQTIADRQV